MRETLEKWGLFCLREKTDEIVNTITTQTGENTKKRLLTIRMDDDYNETKLKKSYWLMDTREILNMIFQNAEGAKESNASLKLSGKGIVSGQYSGGQTTGNRNIQSRMIRVLFSCLTERNC